MMATRTPEHSEVVRSVATITASSKDTILETLRKLNIEEVKVRIGWTSVASSDRPINICTWSIVGRDKETKKLVYKTIIIG